MRRLTPRARARMARLAHPLLALALSSCGIFRPVPAVETAAAGGTFEFPPEWEPHAAVWMGWSGEPDHHPVQVEMIAALVRTVPVRLLVTSAAERAAAAEALRAAGVGLDRLTFHEHEVRNFWVRDPGPLFLSNGRSLAIADFAWDAYGFPNELLAGADPDLLRLDGIDEAMADELGLPRVGSRVVAEGGGLEVSSDVVLAYRDTALQRNPGVPLAEIEREVLRLLGKEKVVWLSRSPLADRVFSGPKIANYFGLGANGHIDEYVRFVDDATVVVARIDAEDAAADLLAAADREILLENETELRAATDAEGRPFEVVTLPVPGLQHHVVTVPLPAAAKRRDPLGAWYRGYEPGDEVRWVPAVSYLNFFVTNGVVLVPRYHREGLPERERAKDEEARATLQRLFPDREIVQIDPLPVNWSGGGMHCITQQEPLVGR